MVASNARTMLERESEMLDEFMRTVTAFAGQAVGKETNLFEARAREFSGHQEFNNKLRVRDDAGFTQDLNKEIKILEAMRATITGDSDIDKYWKRHVDDDIAISKALLATAS
jgi:hypothetical protein